MSQSLECPRCHFHAESSPGRRWRSSCCPDCGAPLVLAVSSPTEAVVRGFLYGSRLMPLRGRRRERLQV